MSDIDVEPKSAVIAILVQLSDRFCAATGQTRSSVAKAIYGRGGQIDDLASGKRDLTTRSAEDAVQWFSDRWPSGSAWPTDMARPDPAPFVDDEPPRLSLRTEAGSPPHSHPRAPHAQRAAAAGPEVPPPASGPVFCIRADNLAESQASGRRPQAQAGVAPSGAPRPEACDREYKERAPP